MPLDSVQYDQHDEALADAMFLARVKAWYDGAAHYSPRRILDGTVLDARTLADGARELLVKFDGVNIPKAVHERDFVCYLWDMTGAPKNGAANTAAITAVPAA